MRPFDVLRYLVKLKSAFTVHPNNENGLDQVIHFVSSLYLMFMIGWLARPFDNKVLGLKWRVT